MHADGAHTHLRWAPSRSPWKRRHAWDRALAYSTATPEHACTAGRALARSPPWKLSGLLLIRLPLSNCSDKEAAPAQCGLPASNLGSSAYRGPRLGLESKCS